jgi:hypothetical protein
MVDKSNFTPPGITTTAANQAQKAMGDRPTTTTNEPKFREGESQLTLQWYGNKGMCFLLGSGFLKILIDLLDVRVKESGVPAITEPTDVIVKVTGTTVCGSDLHLYHKEIMQ